ncbi:MAG: N-6 DNA methylase [Kiritimatiellae bacterium]|nr:N-6 DNA methylase [Kiritimatiellia bacterium]
MTKVDARISAVEAVLHRVERKYAQDPLFNEVCALAALCLLARSGKVAGDFSTVKSAFEQCGVEGPQLEAIIEAIGSHWYEYGDIIGRFSEDDLVDLFEKRYVRMICAKAQCSYSMDALSLELLAIKAGESCLDICAGAGFFANEAWMSISKYVKRGASVNLSGIEFNTDLARYAAVLSAIRGTGGKIHIADCFDPKHLRAKFDKVHCTSPFGLNVRQLDFVNVQKTISQAFPDFPPITLTSADWLFAARAVAALKDGGKAVVIMPRAALSSAQCAQYRRYFVSKRDIESVIAFPEGAYPGTSIAVAVVTLVKEASAIKLFDLVEYEHAKDDQTNFNYVRIARDLALLYNYGDIVTKAPQDILSRCGELDPATYLVEPLPYESRKTLGDLCKTIRGVMLPKDILDRLLLPPGEEGEVGYLSPKNISDGLVDDALPALRETPSGAESAVARPGDLVITRSGPVFKVAVIERELCVVDGNIVVCRPKGVDPWYLAAFFTSAEGAKWLRRMSSGLQYTLSLKKFVQIPVPIAPKKVENRIATEMLRRMERVRELRRELKENLSKINGVFADGMDNGGPDNGN